MLPVLKFRFRPASPFTFFSYMRCPDMDTVAAPSAAVGVTQVPVKNPATLP